MVPVIRKFLGGTFQSIKMLLFSSLLLIFVESLRFARSNIDVTLTNIKYAWKDADSACTLAGSALTVDFDLVTFNISNDYTSGTEAWIGAYVDYSDWINFDGCYLGSLTGQRYYQTTEVKKCLDFCKSAFVLTTNWCVCEDSATTYDTVCSPTLCGNDNYTFCGSYGKSGYCFCKYAPLNITTYEEEVGNCKAVYYRSSSPTFYTKDCDVVLKSRCREGDFYFESRDALTWSHGGLQCYTTPNHQFAGKDVKHTTHPNDGYFWVGILRKFDFHWGNSFENITRYGCVSVTLNENSKFTRRIQKCDTALPVLCDGILYNLTKATTQYTPELSISTNSNLTSHHQQDISTDSYGNTVPIPSSRTSESRVNTSTIVVIVVLGVLFLVIVVMAAWIWNYRRRRRKRGKTFSFATIPIIVSIRNFFARRKSSNNYHAEHQIQREPIQIEVTKAEDAVDENVYDELGNKRQDAGSSDNLYDHVPKQNNDEDLYNHLETFGKQQVTPDVVMYDSADNIRRQEAAMYDSPANLASRQYPGPSEYDSVENIKLQQKKARR